MKVLVLVATGGTGRLIVRFRPSERPFRRGPAPVRSKASAALPGVDMIEGDARDEGTLTSRPCSALISVAYKNRLIAERLKPFKPQGEDRF
jgi:hypothetical protein